MRNLSSQKKSYSAFQPAPLKLSKKWFCKPGFFLFLKTQKKRWVFAINRRFLRLEKSGSDFFSGYPTRKKIRVCRTTFLPPSKSLQRVQIKRLIIRTHFCHFSRQEEKSESWKHYKFSALRPRICKLFSQFFSSH